MRPLAPRPPVQHNWCPLPPALLRTFHKLSSQYSTLPRPITNPSPSHSLLLVVSSRKLPVRPRPAESVQTKDLGTQGPGVAGCTASSLALSDREERKKGFQPSELWLLSEKERKKGKEKKKLTNLFAVGAEVSGGDRSFVTFKITFQNRILLGWKVVRFESGCRIRTLEVRGQRCLSPRAEEDIAASASSEEARAS